jgi:hypothetical protein
VAALAVDTTALEAVDAAERLFESLAAASLLAAAPDG